MHNKEIQMIEITPEEHAANVDDDWEAWGEEFFAATQLGAVRVERVENANGANYFFGLHDFKGDFTRVQTTTMQDTLGMRPDRAFMISQNEANPSGVRLFASEMLASLER